MPAWPILGKRMRLLKVPLCKLKMACREPGKDHGPAVFSNYDVVATQKGLNGEQPGLTLWEQYEYHTNYLLG